MRAVMPLLLGVLVMAPLRADCAAEGLVDSAKAAALATPLTVSRSPRTAATHSPRPSKRKAIIIGAAIGGGVAAGIGAFQCRAECGRGPVGGAFVFAPFGAGIGAGIGFVAWLYSGP